MPSMASVRRHPDGRRTVATGGQAGQAAQSGQGGQAGQLGQTGQTRPSEPVARGRWDTGEMATTAEAGVAAGLSDGDLRDMYQALLVSRLVEEKMLVLLRQGRLTKWFSGIGQEAVSVGIVSALGPRDWVLPMHRNLGVFTGRGLDLGRLLRQLLGREGGYTNGRDRSFHFGSLEHRVVGMISHLGAMLPVADGLALAEQLRGGDAVAVAICGDGATSEGDVHEAMNLAAVWQLPVVFV